MNDAEKVREGEALIRDVATFLATEPNESDRIMARELYQGLDSILTELAEAKEAARIYRAEDVQGQLGTLAAMYDDVCAERDEAEERAEKAEARARALDASETGWRKEAMAYGDRCVQIEARIQELEAALRGHAEFHRQPELTDTPPCCALVEDEA